MGWAKSAENLPASTFMRYPSVDTTFSQIHLAGQSLVFFLDFTSEMLLIAKDGQPA
jgi:hypothetical protein